MAAGFAARRALVTVTGHDDDMAVVAGVSVRFEPEAPVAVELGHAVGDAVAVVLHHGDAGRRELVDHRHSAGLALGLLEGVTDGPADVVDLVVDECLRHLVEQSGVVLEPEQLGGVADADLVPVDLGPHRRRELEQSQPGDTCLAERPVARARSLIFHPASTRRK